MEKINIIKQTTHSQQWIVANISLSSYHIGQPCIQNKMAGHGDGRWAAQQRWTYGSDGWWPWAACEFQAKTCKPVC